MVYNGFNYLVVLLLYKLALFQHGLIVILLLMQLELVFEHALLKANLLDVFKFALHLLLDLLLCHGLLSTKEVGRGVGEVQLGRLVCLFICNRFLPLHLSHFTDLSLPPFILNFLFLIFFFVFFFEYVIQKHPFLPILIVVHVHLLLCFRHVEFQHIPRFVSILLLLLQVLIEVIRLSQLFHHVQLLRLMLLLDSLLVVYDDEHSIPQLLLLHQHVQLVPRLCKSRAIFYVHHENDHVDSHTLIVRAPKWADGAFPSHIPHPHLLFFEPLVGDDFIVKSFSFYKY